MSAGFGSPGVPSTVSVSAAPEPPDCQVTPSCSVVAEKPVPEDA